MEFLERFKAEIVNEDDLKSVSVGRFSSSPIVIELSYFFFNEKSRILLLRHWVRGALRNQGKAYSDGCTEKGCFELGRMYSFPTLARAISCCSECKLLESRDLTVCIFVWLIVSSTRLANVWNGQYSINIKWLGWSFVFLLPTRGWGSRVRTLIFNGFFFSTSDLFYDVFLPF